MYYVITFTSIYSALIKVLLLNHKGNALLKNSVSDVTLFKTYVNTIEVNFQKFCA